MSIPDGYECKIIGSDMCSACGWCEKLERNRKKVVSYDAPPKPATKDDWRFIFCALVAFSACVAFIAYAVVISIQILGTN